MEVVINEKKKRTSKVINVSSNIKIEVIENTISDDIAKKKGRKPKGGKLIVKPIDTVVQEAPLANIILHLKCSSKDLIEYNSKTNSLASISYNPIVKFAKINTICKMRQMTMIFQLKILTQNSSDLKSICIKTI